MIIALTDAGLLIEGRSLVLPCAVAELTERLGPPRSVKLKYNTIHTWDESGLLARSADGRTIQSLELLLGESTRPFEPRWAFAGEVLFGATSLLAYYRRHPEERQRLSSGSPRCTLRRGGYTAYVSERDDTPRSITLEATPQEVPALPPTLPRPLNAEVARYARLWREWREAVGIHVPRTNRHDNWEGPHPEAEVALHNTLPDGTAVPKALLDFYRAGGVAYDGVTSAFAFFMGPRRVPYDLLPLGMIERRWRELHELHVSLSAEDAAAEYDSRVVAEGYANPGWIPFAESRQGDYLLVDAAPANAGTYGQIVELVNEDWTRVTVADSLTELLMRNTARVRAEGARLLQWIIADG